jgi:antitoxin PrlF
MAGEGRPSTSLLPAQREDVDADLRRNDDVEAAVAPRGALISRRILNVEPSKRWSQSLDLRTCGGYYIQMNVMAMATVESAITSKGQATIPKVIRDHLRLKPGDRVKFFIHPDGSVVLLPKLPATALRGIVKPGRRRVTIEDMADAASAGAAVGMARPRRR